VAVYCDTGLTRKNLTTAHAHEIGRPVAADFISPRNSDRWRNCGLNRRASAQARGDDSLGLSRAIRCLALIGSRRPRGAVILAGVPPSCPSLLLGPDQEAPAPPATAVPAVGRPAGASAYPRRRGRGRRAFRFL
jgi:hypothetical protein